MRLQILLIILLSFTSKTIAQIVEIPDANFKDALVNYPVAELGNNTWEDVDTNNDGEIQQNEAESVQKLIVSNFFIDSIEGIQEFVNLIELECAYNNITEVDVSQNLYLEYLNFRNNQLSNLNVLQNQSIEYLDFAHNYLSSIDISQSNNLITLFCDSNLLTDLNTTQNPNLELVQCNENLFSSLSFSENPDLIFLSCSFNNLSYLDVTQNILLETLYCYNNQLANIDVSHNQFLNTFNCRYNQILNIDVTQNPNLISFNCRNNLLSYLDVTQNLILQDLTCNNNEITSLDLSQNLHINIIYCNDNQLSTLNIKQNENESIYLMHAQNNPDLNCIQVDDSVYAYSQNCQSSSGWCKDETAIYSEDCNLSINDSDLQQTLNVYPNPVKSLLLIENNKHRKIEKIIVFDILGKVVLFEKNIFNQLNLSELKSGILFLKIETENGIITKKIIKR